MPTSIRPPLRYNVTVQWSDRHDGYICFVGALMKSARMFAPEMDMIGIGQFPTTALEDGVAKAYQFLDLLSELAILPPREEITPTVEPVDREITVQEKSVSYGNC